MLELLRLQTLYADALLQMDNISDLTLEFISLPRRYGHFSLNHTQLASWSTWMVLPGGRWSF